MTAMGLFELMRRCREWSSGGVVGCCTVERDGRGPKNRVKDLDNARYFATRSSRSRQAVKKP